jgi:hypothetical protein
MPYEQQTWAHVLHYVPLSARVGDPAQAVAALASTGQVLRYEA